MSKNPLFCNGGKNKKVIRNPYVDLNQNQMLSLPDGHPLPAQFARRPFPRFSVILFTEVFDRRIEGQNIHITSVLLAEVII